MKQNEAEGALPELLHRIVVESAAVRAVFSWSYRALRAPAARLFRLLMPRSYLRLSAGRTESPIGPPSARSSAAAVAGSAARSR